MWANTSEWKIRCDRDSSLAYLSADSKCHLRLFSRARARGVEQLRRRTPPPKRRASVIFCSHNILEGVALPV